MKRRDFLNGTALAVGAAIVPPAWLRALEAGAVPEDVYPPALTGLRGSHDGSWEVAHALKDGLFWRDAGQPADTGEHYALAVVGGGLSGLAAAWFFREAAGPDARVLILDNHDDFGGHAKRNEFTAGGRRLIGYGGTWAIDSPAPYSATARRLLRTLGIDVHGLAARVDHDWHAHLGRATFFSREGFGADRLVFGPQGRSLAEFAAEAPLSERQRRDLVRLHEEPRDWMPGLGSDEKKARLARISYGRFLTELVGVDPALLPLFDGETHGLYGVGVDAIPAQDCWGLGLPGFSGMGLEPGRGPGMGLDTIQNEEADRFLLHFPDGNATLARLLVRSLVPGALPGDGVEDSIEQRVDYSRLDVEGAATRIRLRSTAVRVRHEWQPGAPERVEVGYVRDGRFERATAERCVLACYHAMIPFLCPDVPEAQGAALRYGTKVPLCYSKVVLRDREPFERLGVHSVSWPGGYHRSVGLDTLVPARLGSYRHVLPRDEPVVVHLARAPCQPGLTTHEQHRMGRIELYTTRFATFEERIREQLDRLFAGAGFDAGRDLLAITVNRWPHGYAYQYNSLADPFWLEGGELPCEVARRRIGRIAIANSDAGAYAYTDGAIDQGHRAVRELLEEA